MVRSWPRRVTRRREARCSPLASLLARARRGRLRLRLGVLARSGGKAELTVTRDFGAEPDRRHVERGRPRRRDRDAPAAARVHGRDALRRRLRAGDRRRRRRARRTGARSTGSSTSTGSSRARARRRASSRRATGSGGTTTTGARRCASRRSSARSRSRSPRPRAASKIPVRIDCADDAVTRLPRGRRAARGARARWSAAPARSARAPARRCCGCWSGAGREVRADPTARADRAGAEGLGRVRAADRGRQADRRCSTRAGGRCARSAPAAGLRRGDAVPRPAADLGGDRHRRRRRRRGGRRAGRRRG